MARFQAILIATFGALLATPCLGQQTAPTAPAATSQPSPAQASVAQTATAKGQLEVDALALMAKGDNWMGANLFRRAVAKDASVLNRFNLATAYQRTGRFDEARKIYRQLASDGRTTNVVSSPMPGVAGGGVRNFNVADEAVSRLAYVDWELSRAPAANSAGKAASATEISDQSAAALDAQARTVTQVATPTG